MRIVLLIPQLVFGRDGGFVGGYVNSVINLMEVMQDDCELTLVAGVSERSDAGIDELSNRLRNTRLQILNMRQRPSTAGYFGEFAFKVVARCFRNRQFSADIVYGHSGHPGYGLTTLLAAKAMGACPVHALYCPVSEEFQGKKLGWLTRVVVREAFRRVPNTVAISRNVSDSVARFSAGLLVPELLLPAIPDNFAPDAVALNKRSRHGSEVIAGFVGHHKHEKGLDLALAAVKIITGKGIRMRLVALTSGGESRSVADSELQAMVAAHGVEEQVSLVRGIKDMRDFYAGIDFMLIPFRGTRGPSDYPMVLLEAMGLGVPVVCTPVGAMCEAVIEGKNGFLAREASVGALVEALEKARAAMNDRRDEIVSDAIKVALRFRASTVSRETQNLFSRLLLRPVKPV